MRPATPCTPGSPSATNYTRTTIIHLPRRGRFHLNEELLSIISSKKTSDPRMRAYLINRQVDDIRGTVYRQTMFAEFEKSSTRWKRPAKPSPRLLPLRLSRFASGLLRPDFALDSELDLECLRIPHFYSAFYVYNTPPACPPPSASPIRAPPRPASGGSVSRLLKSGGSQFPSHAPGAGVDMTTPSPSITPCASSPAGRGIGGPPR